MLSRSGCVWISLLFSVFLLPAVVAASDASQKLLPDAPSYSSYAPALTGNDKFDLFLQRTLPQDILLGTTFDAGWAQLTDNWPGYGRGMQGFGKRWGALIADQETKSFFETLLLPTLLHQDPRYFRMGPRRPFSRRLTYALSRVLVTRNDDGRNTFNSSLLLSTVLAKSLSNAYYPQQERGFSHTMNSVEGSLLGSAQGYILREFLPDILGMCRRHESKWLKRAERKLPFSRRFDPDAYPDLAQPSKKLRERVNHD
jgi:hypothetical protein